MLMKVPHSWRVWVGLGCRQINPGPRHMPRRYVARRRSRDTPKRGTRQMATRWRHEMADTRKHRWAASWVVESWAITDTRGYLGPGTARLRPARFWVVMDPLPRPRFGRDLALARLPRISCSMSHGLPQVDARMRVRRPRDLRCGSACPAQTMGGWNTSSGATVRVRECAKLAADPELATRGAVALRNRIARDVHWLAAA